MAIEVTSVHERRRPRVIKALGCAVRRGAKSATRRKLRIIIRSIIASIALTLAIAIVFLVHSYNSYAKIVDARLAHGYLTSHAGIYAAPRTLRTGQTLTPAQLVTLLSRAGYIEDNASDVWSGSFSVRDRMVEIRPRRLSLNSSRDYVPDVVQVAFNQKGRIEELKGDAISLESYTLEPELLTSDASMKAGQSSTLSYRNIPEVLVHAITSIEDRRFFEHSGLDIFGVGRAILRNAGDERMGQGGSTITQQLVKNSYLSPERTLRRKFAEAMLAFTLERRLSKEDIFSLYCNEVYLGQRGAAGIRGIEQAARVFFGKELKELSLAESATIAGMIQSPNRYAPDRHEEAAVARRNTVINAMLRDGWITKSEAAAASNEPLKVAPADNLKNESLAPYFVDYVNRVAENQMDAKDATEKSAPRIYTTLDLDLQQLAEDAIRHQLERLDKVYKGKATPQAAFVALDPKTGNVLAMVGGRDYAISQLNRATDALRQPGSVYKPIVYSAALESFVSPVEMFKDAPQQFVYDGKVKYSPANYGGGYSMRDVTMRTGLVKSLNVVTVDVAMRTGLARIARYAENFGLQRPQPYPALALGTTEATPLQLAAAYTVFANNGARAEPQAIARATDATGATLFEANTQTRKVIQPETAYMITNMLTDVIDHGTARAARGIVKKTAIAGKTGTSRDGWFIGYTPNLVCAVWIGFDDNKQLGLTGAEAALPAWTEFVKNAVELRPELGGEGFDYPAGIKFVDIDPETGMLATSLCPHRERIAVTYALAPNTECFKHNEAYELVASAQDETVTDSSYATTDNTRATELSASNLKRSSTLPRPLTRAEVADTLLRSTHVELDRRGRSTLVNDMRLRP